MISHIRAAIFLSLISIPVYGQLYLLTASPTSHINEESPSYPSSVLRPDGEGGAIEVREIVGGQSGVSWVGVSYDERKAVIVTDPLSGPANILVLDFDKADVVKNCEWPQVKGGRTLIAEWLAVQPGSGLSLEWNTSGPDPVKDNFVHAILLDPSLPCDRSVWEPQPEDERYVIAHGGAGMGGYVSQDTQLGLSVSQKDKNGEIYTFVGHAVPLGYQIPTSLGAGFYENPKLVASNQSLFSVFIAGKTIFFRRRDKTWHGLQPSSALPSLPRAFGKYLVTSEIRNPRSGRPSEAGSQEWRRTESAWGPPTAAVPDAELNTGRLLIYDTESEKEFSISTNQGDSEVLLIENGVIYYRSATRLYSAPLTKDGVGAGRLLATSELIRDAHWAFMSH